MIELTPIIYAATGAFFRTFYGIWKAFNYDHCVISKKKIIVEFLFSLTFGIFGAFVCSEIGYLKFATNITAMVAGLLGANSIDLIVKRVGLSRKLEVNVVEKVEYPELNPNQRKALEYVKQEGKITAKIYQNINEVERNTAKWELKRMVDLGYLKKCGKRKGAYYILKKIEMS
jgi:hypothetical protein